ncbi:MAG: DUF7342 family protein [Halodesulfurarchaeum sp.]
MVEEWTESMTARERVETIATTMTEPRSPNWVATQAEVEWDTAKKHLENLRESGLLLLTAEDKYVPDPTRAYFDHLRDLILEHSKTELRTELTAIADRIDEWKARYDVDSPSELEATLATDLPGAAVRERQRALRQWENSLESRDRIRRALELYDDITALSKDLPGTTQIGTPG